MRLKKQNNQIADVFDGAMELLFPSKCILCRKLIGPGGPRVCEACMTEYIDRQRNNPDLFWQVDWTSGCVGAMEYRIKDVREAMIAFKFGGCSAYADGLSELLAAMVYAQETIRFDMISWIPLSPDRKRRRGYDQAELLARAAARRLQTEAVPTLRKKRGVKPQSLQRDEAARKKNIQGVYSVPEPSVVADRRILLIDDVITTGATMSAAAEALMRAGADAVYGAGAACSVTHRKQSAT